MSTSRHPPAQGHEDSRPKVTVVVVNYQSWPDVEALASALASGPEFAAGELQVVVVDNASDGPVPPALLDLPSPKFRLLLREENGGFAVGVNAGWRLARGPWLLVLNPDVEIEEGSIGQVIERIAAYAVNPDGPPGIVGFGLRNADGSTQGSVGVFPSLARTIREQFIPRPRRKYQAGWRIHPGPVDWVTGACMLINARMLAELGGMDEDFFLYHEEVALCRRARDAGWRVEFDPTIQVTHRHPLQDRSISPKMRVILRHSKLLYFRKHLPGWQFRALSRLIGLEAAVRGPLARVAGDVPTARAWKLIGGINRRLRAGAGLRGQEVLRLAEQVPSPGRPRSRRKPGPHRGRDRKPSPDDGGPTLVGPPGPAQERPG
jgi:GT2 family glycosyltransferase